MSMAALDDDAEWYAIRTKPREEDRVDLNLRTRHVETFAPKLKELSPGYGGHYVSKPLFSGYIFAHFNAVERLHDVRYTRGVQNVVSFGDSPIAIDDEVVNLIKDRVGTDGFIRLGDEFKYGDKVTIKFGPLKNLVGIFQKKMRDSDRVKILLDAVSYQSHLLIERAMIEKVN